MRKLILFVGVCAIIIIALYQFKTTEVINDVPLPPLELKDNRQAENPIPPGPPQPDVPPILRSVFEQARRENKQVLLFLTIDGCVHCERMKSTVFPNVRLNNFVLFETKDVDVHTKYGVHSFPTFIILDKNANEIRRHSGYQGTLLFQRWLDK